MLSDIRSIEALALFGAEPCFAAPIYVGRPNGVDSKKLVANIKQAMARQWLTNDGPIAHALEAELAGRHGVDHCALVSNGTTGIQIVAKALQLTGEVLLPAFTFVGTANALEWIGLRPVFCDVDPITHNISIDEVVQKKSDKTSAILGVHLWGRPCEVDRLQKVADFFGIELIYDGAHAFGCTLRGKSLASYGRAMVLSLHATKCVTTLEGGAVLTNDASLAEEIRLMRNFGFTDEDKTGTVGINAKLNEFSAAMGQASHARFDEVMGHNERILSTYREELRSTGLEVLGPLPQSQSNYHYAILDVRPEIVRRDTLYSALRAEQVIVRRYFSPGCHRLRPYLGTVHDALPVTESLSARLLALPTGTQMSVEDAKQIAQIINFVIDNKDLIEGSLLYGIEAKRRA